MRTPSAIELLAAWDRGCLEQPLDRPLVLLAAACDVPVAVLAAASLGRREALLLALRERTFGPCLDGLATCPMCATEVQVAVVVEDVRISDGADGEPARVVAGGYELDLRVPDSRDATAAAAAASGAEPARARAIARTVLLERCLSVAASADLPAEVVDAAVAAMADADPQADVRLALTCPECAAGWEVAFDAGTFLWSEVDAWARRTLLEVHQLAAAYGWSEAEVLALGPRRRRAYLELTCA